MPPSSAVSAIPAQLERYAGEACAIDDDLQRAGALLQDALDAFTSRPSDIAVRVDPLGDEMVALAQVARDLDEWTGRVGTAFRLADAGWSFLGSLMELWLGITYDPVRARPEWSDEQVAAALEALLGLDPDRPPGAIVQPLVGPDLVRDFVGSLTPAQLAALAADHPELVGPVDGMPHELRYAANRTLIDRALAQARLDGDAELVATLEGLAGEGRQFLFFDPAGDGRAAEVFGDLGTAENVTVFVPGVTNRLDNFDATRGNASRIHDEMGRLDPDGSHATIAWLGYDTPGLIDAPLPGRAHESAPLLRQLWDGLDLPEAVTTTVVGHSYGSLVSATALRDGFEGVDNLVVVGSPGLQAGDLDDLQLADGVQFFAGRAPFDTMVASLESFGRDPSDPRFDGIRIATGSGPEGFVTGHSSYTTAGSESLRNLALIGLGRLDEVSTIEPTLGDRVVGGVDDLHDLVVEGPLDTLQWTDERVDAFVNDVVDGVQDVVPLGPLAGVVDGLQDGIDVADHYGDTLLDGIQRLTSPDFVGDVLGDWFAVDGPGRLLDRVAEHGQDVLDGIETVVDTGRDVVDAGLATAGDAIDRGLDTAEDVGETVYDNTIGRLPGF